MSFCIARGLLGTFPKSEIAESKSKCILISVDIAQFPYN